MSGGPTYSTDQILDPTEHKATHDGLASGSEDVNNNKLELFRGEALANFVSGGGVWTADNAGVNRNASMTSVVAYINGKRVTASAVSARTFTASKDTYVDLGDDGVITYTEVANNAASPSLASNAIRIAVVITGATTIASQNAINQGQLGPTGPTISSVILSVVDSLGNLIYNRNPTPGVIGYRQATSDQGGITSEVDLTGLSVPVIVPANKRIKITTFTLFANTAAGNRSVLRIKESTTTYSQGILVQGANATNETIISTVILMPSTGSHTYKLSGQATAGTSTLANATMTSFIIVEII